jgi:hypothetical protein
VSEPLLEGVIAHGLQDRLEELHREECWGEFERGFIYMRSCAACGERAKREPDAINALECSLRAAQEG